MFKNRKLLSILMMIALVLTMVPTGITFADTPTPISFFTYDDSGATVRITDYNIAGPKNVVIPQMINGKLVTVIGANAFASKGLTSLVLPSKLVTIESGAFSGNTISKVYFPITEIGRAHV